MVFVKYAEQDCQLITKETKIEYGYTSEGIFYSEYGGNPIMKDPYPKGEVLFSKPVNGTSFNEELEIESGYYKLWVIARGGPGGKGYGYRGYREGAGSGGSFFGIVKLSKGKYKFSGNGYASIVDPDGVTVINCTQGGSGTSPYNEQGVQGSGGQVTLKNSGFLSIIKPSTMSGLGGIVKTTGGVVNQGYGFWEEVEDFGQGANGSSYSASTTYTPKDGIIKLVYFGETQPLQEGDIFFGAWGNSKESKTYTLNFPKGIYRFRGISQGGYGGYNQNGYNTYYGGGGSSGYHYEAYLSLEGEYQITISGTISFSKPDSPNYFTLNSGNGGGYGTSKLNYSGGSAPSMIRGENLSEVLKKEAIAESKEGSGYNPGNLNVKILGRECGRGESGVNGRGRDYIDYSIYGNSGFEFIYYGNNMPPEPGDPIFESVDNQGGYLVGNFDIKIPVTGKYKIEACTNGLPCVTTPSNAYASLSHPQCAGGLSGSFHTFETVLESGNYSTYIPEGTTINSAGYIRGTYEYINTTYNVYAGFPELGKPLTISKSGEIIYSLKNDDTLYDGSTNLYILGEKVTSNTSPYEYTQNSSTQYTVKLAKCLSLPKMGSGGLSSKVSPCSNNGIVETTLEQNNLEILYNKPTSDNEKYLIGGYSPVNNKVSGPGAGGTGWEELNGVNHPSSSNNRTPSRGGYLKITYLGPIE